MTMKLTAEQKAIHHDYSTARRALAKVGITIAKVHNVKQADMASALQDAQKLLQQVEVKPEVKTAVKQAATMEKFAEKTTGTAPILKAPSVKIEEPAKKEEGKAESKSETPSKADIRREKHRIAQQKYREGVKLGKEDYKTDNLYKAAHTYFGKNSPITRSNLKDFKQYFSYIESIVGSKNMDSPKLLRMMEQYKELQGKRHRKDNLASELVKDFNAYQQMQMAALAAKEGTDKNAYSQAQLNDWIMDFTESEL